jgi:hypothetical protein
MFSSDSPAMPPSVTARELFRGFSFVAQSIYDEEVSSFDYPSVPDAEVF